ncbi:MULTISPECIES: Zn-dependent hydrolase [unclassified Methylobacterium]|uniref:Zn-dependent hydrolase n=1 Tax=unclassified Methylobacterium TaxID=2615210 RepID=UPI0011C1D57F|nr:MULTISPECIES: Zn-dependent hydrolase [unclassified Methylobacterium]QEE39138.1 hydantoinase/carbamoylase family amidase [Methylobacterium sp. WL1]TXN55602.1 hydantoinase/carbamoylase family amidase [Methylobacterium sp. WL2]
MNGLGAATGADLIAIDPDFCAGLFAQLLSFSHDEPGVTRAAYGEGEERAHALMRATGLALGLRPECDAAGNLFLTMLGRDPALSPWMVGSHVDTVPHGGNFDGAAGVIGGLAALEALRRAGLVPARPVTVAVFRAEESVWFPASYVGSRAAFGLLPPDVLDLPRADSGRSLREHMAELGLRPEAVARGERLLDPTRIHGFVEMHIEQGPALEATGVPVGFVTAISGSFRYRKAACFGRYGHSGAVARSERSDAVFALADLITGLDALWGTLEAEGRPATITLGEVGTDPVQHAFAKIPGEVRFCLDVRSTEPAVLDRIEAALAELVAAIEAARGVRFVLGERTGSTPARMSSALVEALSGHAHRLGMPFRTMPSGAGHDTATLAGQGVPSTMIFIRNQNGSHNPHEAMRIEDLCAAAALVAHLVAEA